MFLRQTSFSLSDYIFTCRVILSREAVGGWTDDWTLKDRGGDGLGGGGVNGLGPTEFGLGLGLKRPHDKFQVAATVFNQRQLTFYFLSLLKHH